MDDELLDLVDSNDNIIGVINRQDYGQLMSEKLGYIRAADLFIVNSKGQIFTPVRTKNKTIAPGGYDYSAGGHVESGEDYLTAILREAKEELNIEISNEDLVLVAKTSSEKIRYIRSVFLLRSDVTPAFNPNDFVSADWLYPEEMLRSIDSGHPAKSNLGETIIMLQDFLTKS